MRNQLLRFFTMVAIFAITVSSSFAQKTITGVIVDESTGEPMVGATIKIVGTTSGAVADLNGKFTLKVEELSVKLEFSFIGYETKTMEVKFESPNAINLGKVALASKAIGLGGINIVADRARERETPVAFTNVSKKQVALQLGSQDLPMIMNNTPGVYATAQGGGAGDARINVRGFNQRNVAIMINGVPVNDMENGWVYWSNWDGIADATSSIQMQRGLSAVNLATPSIGGTMNIITSPADNQAGIIYKTEVGSGNFLKNTITANSGLINNKYAVSAAVVRKTGIGVIDGTWTDAWAYYFGASYNLNKNHRLEVYAVGAPQRHGQNLYKQNVATYDSAFACEIGADSAAAHKAESVNGQLFNETYSSVNSSYGGMQFWNGKERERFSKNFISERENYYHKPLVNLNWYAKWSEKISQFTTVYYSGGTGGGSGTYGSMKWDYTNPTRVVDYDATIANNTVSDTAKGILRNSVNNQWTVGAISKVKVDITKNLKAQVGIDWRTAEIEHYYEVRDLLGGKFFVYKGNDFDAATDYNKVLGDKIYYYNTNTVDWTGAYAQVEYSKEKLTAYATYGFSMIKYSYVDHFTKDSTGSEFSVAADWIKGNQIKGGVSYKLKKNFAVYGNFGLVSKVPIFDNVIDDASGILVENPTNETFQSFEIGADFATNDNKLQLKGNIYYTDWKNRSLSKYAQVSADEDTYVAITGMNQNHKGFEFEGKYRINNLLGVGAVASVGNWMYTSDVSGSYSVYNPVTDKRDSTVTLNFYTAGLKVGDAPQTQMGVYVDFFPVKGMQLQAIYRYNDNYYAEWDPFSRTKESDEAQVWEIPAFGLLDLHLSYVLPTKGNVGVEVFAHVFNALNTKYVQDAVDNSAYNGYYGVGTDKPLSHTANSAEVYMGLPRTFNIGAKFNIH